MANPSEFFFKSIRKIQQYRRKIEPLLDIMEKGGLLLDRLEQAEHEESKITQVRLILDAIDDSLKAQTNHRTVR